MAETNPINSLESPALWTPNALANWSVIISPIFGGILASKNWETLGESKKAKSSMYWVYIHIAFWAVFPFTDLPIQVAIVLLAAWYFMSLRPQAKYVKNTFGENFTKKSWKKPLGIGFSVYLVWFMLLMVVLPFDDGFQINDGFQVDAEFQEGLDAYNRKDYKTALEKWRPLAEQGHADTQYNLGIMYKEGQGVAQDYKEAVKWYRKAAEQGDADAQYNLGVMYDNGQGVAQDYKEAVKWYRKAAEQGMVQAQYNLGIIYYLGQGVPQDYKEAVKWIRKVAQQGVAQAQFNLGVLYENGQGVAQDYKEAVKWYRKAAQQNHSGAKKALKKLKNK